MDQNLTFFVQDSFHYKKMFKTSVFGTIFFNNIFHIEQISTNGTIFFTAACLDVQNRFLEVF